MEATTQVVTYDEASKRRREIRKAVHAEALKAAASFGLQMLLHDRWTIHHTCDGWYATK